MAGAVEVNLLAAMEAVAERWHAVFMTLVRYQQPSLSQLVLVVRLELQGLLTLAASAEHHLLQMQVADLPCKRVAAVAGAVQMAMIAAEVVAEEPLAQVPEAQVHQAMILLGLVEAQLVKVPQPALAWEGVEQTEEKGQRLASVQNLAGAVEQEQEQLVVVVLMVAVRYSVQEAVGLVYDLAAPQALGVLGVHIRLVAEQQVWAVGR